MTANWAPVMVSQKLHHKRLGIKPIASKFDKLVKEGLNNSNSDVLLPHKPTRKAGHTKVEKNHDSNRPRTQAVDVGSETGAGVVGH